MLSALVCVEGHRDRSNHESGIFNMLDGLGPISQYVWCTVEFDIYPTRKLGDRK